MLKFFLYLTTIFLLVDQNFTRVIDYDEALQEIQEYKDIQNLIDSSEIELIEQLEDSKVVQPELHDSYKRNYNEQLKALSTLKILLESLQNKGGSAFKSVPYAPKVVEKYVNAYLKQIAELEKKMKPSKRNRNKRAVCGSLNGNAGQTNKWICW